MRRPFAIAGFSYLAVLIAASYAGFGISAAMTVFFALCAAVAFFGFKGAKYHRAVSLGFCACAVALLAYCAAEALFYEPAAAFDSKTAHITGTIVEAPVQSYGKYIYTVQTDKITVGGKARAFSTKIRLQTDVMTDAEAFDRIEATAVLSLPKTNNAAGFDSRAFYKSKGVYLFASAADIKTTRAKSRPPYYYAIKLRQYISGVMQRYVGGSGGSLAAGILIGDTSGLSDTVTSDFSTTGISHILAVSGTQTSLIMEYLLLLLCALRLPRRPAAAITAGVVFAFMAVTGFSPSVMRAGLMSILCLAGMLLRRDADALNSLGLSALILCLANPYAATDIGLLLSFFATLGMVTISKRLNTALTGLALRLPPRVRPLLTRPGGILCETIGASLMTYPVIILTFGRVSLTALLANIIEVPVSLAVTLLAAVLALLSPAPFLIFLIRPIALLIRLLCAFMMWFAHLLAGLPFSAVSSRYGFVSIMLIFAVLILALFFIFRRHGAHGGVCAVCVCFVLSVGIFSYCVAQNGVLTIAPQSGGGALLIKGSHAVVLDLPSKNSYLAIENTLKARNIGKVDAVVLSGYDKDRARALSALEADLPVKSVFIPSGASADTAAGTIKPGRIAVPSSLTAIRGVYIVLLPDSTQKRLAALVSYGASRTFVTGGGDLTGFSAYNISAFKSALLVFGGGLDNGFAKAVSPEYAVCAAPDSEAAAVSSASLAAQGADVEGAGSIYMTRGNGKFSLQLLH